MPKMAAGGRAPVLGGICLVALCACGDDGGELRELQIIGNMRFDRAFSLVSEAGLSFRDDDPLGYVSDLLVTKDGFVVADRIQSNIKMFDRGGNPTMTLARISHTVPV